MIVRSMLLVVLAASSVGQDKPKQPPTALTVDRIFKEHEYEAQGASVKWLPEGSSYTTWEDSKETPGGHDLVQHDPATGKSEILVPAAHLIPPREYGPLSVENYALSKDRARLLIFTNSKRVWRQNTRGDYWVLDRATRELRKLGGEAPPSSLMHAKLAPVGPRVAYVRQNNLYVEDLRDGKITARTDSKSPDEINGTFDWVYEEEFSLRDGFRWSPDGKFIAFWKLDTSKVREYPLVNTTDSLYPKIMMVRYPKVGERNASCELGILGVNDAGRISFAIDDDAYLAYAEWADSAHLVTQKLNRAQNSVLVHSHEVPFTDDKLTPILQDSDRAWIDLQDDLHFFRKDDGTAESFLWLSERDGWRHLYRVDLADQRQTLLTPEPFDVIAIAGIDRDHRTVYFTASPDNATQKYLYVVGLDGKGMRRVSPKDQPGTHDYDLSPDGRFAVHHFSTANTPPVVEMIRLPGHDHVKLFTDNADLRKKLEKLEPVKTEFFRVDIGDGVTLDGWCMLPPHLDPKAKYPLLVHVYGEPAGQTVLDRWGGGNALWHRMLAEQGYVVMSFDNRGTPAPKGRAWRKAVHRQIGILAPKDQAAAIRAVLKERPYLDPDRVGVWGWSGGGSMSLNAIFKFPDLYKTAISIAPVANQRLYDTIYQERYMGLPGDNVDGYIQGSAINFAHQLRGNLLIIHGTGDDNCHYQGTEMLINELIRHDRPFTMMAYPNRSHGIYEGDGTTLHLRHLMTRYLREHLPPGPKPRAEHQ